MQQKRDPQKNSQNRRLLREALVEGNPSHLDLKMTSRGPGKPPTGSTMGGSTGCRGRGTSSPCGPARIHNYPSQVGPYWAIPPAGGLRWSTGSLRRNHIVWPLTGDLTSPLPLERAEQGPKALVA
ncbi:hypothetical protein E2C01_055660 [Portunus trituberculatus]|uniref:Uncharacterized protein n=1 Tax=Portunus trituberculatus TaxID=210409 RepID=A0A5B7GVD7_PORTR|nr:hypothetical protein [Portunus trituberculatus]